MAKYDPIVLRRLSEGPAHTSGEIQNDIIEAFAKMVSDKICVNVRNAGIYSILADETKDCSKKEQLFFSCQIC